jgi:hypothetical protein
MTQSLKKEKRDKFPSRELFLVGAMQKEAAKLVIDNAPVDMANPIRVLIGEASKARKMDQNAAMWAGPLFDIAEQAYIEGRTYSAEVWHDLFKRRYLPEEFDADLCKEGYRKWDYAPDGERILVGSTTQLLIKGFAQYLEQVTAYGSSLGVMFRASPIDRLEA